MPRAKKNMTSLLDSFESDTEKEHDAAVTAAVKTPKKSSTSQMAAMQEQQHLYQ